MRGDNVKEADFEWQLKAFKALVGINPAVIIVDRELAMLNAFETLFPETPVTLCVWHVRRAIEEYCRKFFLSPTEYKKFFQLWMDYESSGNEGEEIRNREVLLNPESYIGQLKDGEMAAKIIRYLQTTWINPHHVRIVKRYVDTVRHLGVHITSGVEKMHDVLKKFLKKFDKVGGFHSFALALDKVVKVQGLALQNKLGKQGSSVGVPWRDVAFFDQIMHNVSDYAIAKVFEPYQEINSDELTEQYFASCTGYHKRCLGYPCKHVMGRYIQRRMKLPLSGFHDHWIAPEMRLQSTYSTSEPMLIIGDRMLPSREPETNAERTGRGRLESGFEPQRREHGY